MGLQIQTFLLLFQMIVPDTSYQIFDRKGLATQYQTLLEEAQQADIVLFGELHNKTVCHQLELQLTEDLFKNKGKNLILGAEMFEADNQLIVNEYLQGLITETHLKNEAKVWENYDTDYKPLLDFALNHQLPFVATNIPRRYASMVARLGMESLEKSLTKEAKKWIAPLPIPVDLSLPAYKNMVKMMQDAHGGMNPENFAKAQAVKDATMAYFILENYDKSNTFLHFNGTYHSDNFESIVWHLQKQRPKLKILTISTVEQSTFEKLADEHKNKANFVLVIK
jgi:uncharacterized iron-regulated protein